ncbi:MAG TPA: redox-sensing transcriptional repressor Rex [Clostridiales bacterium]|nr:redox-sensing transcriptional repressor Rex [Clostridiales bacterium]
MVIKISEKKIERLSLYRRRLYVEQKSSDFIFSHDLAKIANSNAAQVRRDLMSVGYAGSSKKGYNIKLLIKHISDFLDPDFRENVVIVGAGNLGRALLTFFKNRQAKLCLVAAFDTDPKKIGRDIGGTKCYHTDDLASVIRERKVKIGVISTNESATEEIAEKMVSAGIRSIINFTCIPVRHFDGVHVEQVDITASFEKAAFFTK